MAAPAAGLVEMDVLICLGVVLICLVYVSTRLPWVLSKDAASFEKQFGPSAAYGKSKRAAGPLHKQLLALVRGVDKEGGVLGVGVVGDKVGEDADLNRYLVAGGLVASACVPGFASSFLAGLWKSPCILPARFWTDAPKAVGGDSE